MTHVLTLPNYNPLAQTPASHSLKVCVYTYIMYTHSTGTFDPFPVFLLVSFGFERGSRENTKTKRARSLIKRISYVIYVSATFAERIYTVFFLLLLFGQLW